MLLYGEKVFFSTVVFGSKSERIFFISVHLFSCLVPQVEAEEGLVEEEEEEEEEDDDDEDDDDEDDDDDDEENEDDDDDDDDDDDED